MIQMMDAVELNRLQNAKENLSEEESSSDLVLHQESAD
jgi:hypothetical protein